MTPEQKIKALEQVRDHLDHTHSFGFCDAIWRSQPFSLWAEVTRLFGDYLGSNLETWSESKRPRRVPSRSTAKGETLRRCIIKRMIYNIKRKEARRKARELKARREAANRFADQFAAHARGIWPGPK